MIKLLYIMRLSEIVGCTQEKLTPSQDVSTVGALLGQRGEQYQQALGEGSKLQITINKKFVEPGSATIGW